MAKGTSKGASPASGRGTGSGAGGGRVTEAERKARVDAMRRAQKAGERRRTMLVVGAAAALVVVLIAVVAVAIVRQQRAQDPRRMGVAAAAADCSTPTTEEATGVMDHVGPGTPTPDVTTVDYTTVPAVFGAHYASPAYPAAPFYTAEDTPAVETLVHNLEHGYTVAWYSSDLPAAEREQLEEIAGSVRTLSEAGGKFIAAPWDETRGAMPDGAAVGLAHWGAQDGVLQLCGAVSGEAIADFVEAHPSADSPEPNGA